MLLFVFTGILAQGIDMNKTSRSEQSFNSVSLVMVGVQKSDFLR
jgi:hypothetical protein